MLCLKIKVFKDGGNDPETTCTIPTSVLKVAIRLIPKQAKEALRKKGIGLEEIVKLSSGAQTHGTLLEVEDHRKRERVVITVE